ncbi:MAG TPA: porin [Cyclobacteriaceae bacterium]|nr:porin [Cyclobacteriaceae bacterium]
MTFLRRGFLATFLFSISFLAAAQEQPVMRFFKEDKKGFGVVSGDSLYSVKFQFRMQNRAAYVSESLDDLAAKSFELRVRRLRLKLEGFVYDPKLTYYIQLSFSRGDMDWRGTENSVVNTSPNVIRDAVIYYNPTENLKFGFGQTKLPGNRQRVISSGDQQFVDRSLVNATFNIDRDFGFFAHFTTGLVNLSGAITSGEGRNALSSNKGLAYTGRIEYLPLGRFTGENDYIEGDLEREPLPKLSLGSTISYNDKAMREGGQLGSDLFAPRGIRTIEFDALFKYRGWAFYNEFMQRHTSNPVTAESGTNELMYVYDGEGYLSQLSYLFKNDFEIAGRYLVVVPDDKLYDNPSFPLISEPQVRRIELGVTRYLIGHRLKIQANVVRTNHTDLLNDRADGGFWSMIFQIEIGI